MSFASEAREELSRMPLGASCCMRAESAGMLNAGGVIALSGGSRSIYMESEQAAVSQRAFSLFRHAIGARAELRSYKHSAGDSAAVFRVILSGEDAGRAFEMAGLLGLGVDSRFEQYEPCCRRAFLRGAFLLCGTLGDPGKGYHMEWRLARESCAEWMREMLGLEGIESKVTMRRERYVLYMKEAERIADALALMGAVEALLALENVRVVKELRNRVNRQVNCESANVDKATEAAYRQIEAIRRLEATGVLRGLSGALRETAELRLEHPEATLEELGGMFLEPVGKSGVNHRLRKLQALARDAGSNDLM